MNSLQKFKYVKHSKSTKNAKINQSSILANCLTSESSEDESSFIKRKPAKLHRISDSEEEETSDSETVNKPSELIFIESSDDEDKVIENTENRLNGYSSNYNDTPKRSSIYKHHALSDSDDDNVLASTSKNCYDNNEDLITSVGANQHFIISSPTNSHVKDQKQLYDDNTPVKKIRSRLHSVSDSDSSTSNKGSNQRQERKKRKVSSSEYEVESGETDSNSELDDDEPDTFSAKKSFKYVAKRFPDCDNTYLRGILRNCKWNVNCALKAIRNDRAQNEIKQEKKQKPSPRAHKACIKSTSGTEASDMESDENDVVTLASSTILFDSDDEMSTLDEKITPERQKIIDFLQNSTSVDLQNIPNCGLRKVNAIMAARPFIGWLDLVTKLRTLKFLDTDLLEGTRAVIEMNNSLDRILKCCEELSIKINDDAAHLLEDISGHSQMLENKLIAQPALLNDRFTLKPHQLLATEWMYLLHERKVNCILADEMGLGKTIETIGLLAYLKDRGISGSHVIIVPSSTIENWLNEFERWFPSCNVLPYIGSQQERLQLRHDIVKKQTKTFDVIITTYNLVTRNVKDLLLFKKLNFHYAIFDEAHMMKNAATQCYRSLMQIRARRRLLLTGTPLQNSLMELLSILMFALPGLFKGNREQIEKMFAVASKRSQGCHHYQRRIEQAKKIMKPFILRRLKEDVLQDLPEKRQNILMCKMEGVQKKIYDEMITKFSAEYDSLYGADKGLSLMLKLRKAANHPLLLRKLYTDRIIADIANRLARDEFYKETNETYVLEDLSFLSDFEIHTLCKKFSTCRSCCLPDDQMLASGKFLKLDELLPKMKEQKNKVLIFSQFTMVLDIMEEYMRIRDHSFLRLDGTTPVMKRQDLMDEFNGNDDIFIFLLSTRSGGLGINLTSANVVLLHDIDFNPFNDKQAEDRCHRVGQTKNVTVYKMISEDSIDENILKRANEKLLLEKHITEDISENNEVNVKETSSILQSVLRRQS